MNNYPFRRDLIIINIESYILCLQFSNYAVDILNRVTSLLNFCSISQVYIPSIKFSSANFFNSKLGFVKRAHLEMLNLELARYSYVKAQ